MSLPFPEPTARRASQAEVLLGYLDYFRSVLVDPAAVAAPPELRRASLAGVGLRG